jgi:glycogen(starch) synthase
MRLLFVARAAPHKGLADLLAALASLARSDWSLSVIGAIAKEDAPRLAVAAERFGPRLVTFGARPLAEVAAIMRAHDALVVPSRYENFCNAALEGLACGLPVLGVSVGGIRDMVCHESNGFLFPPRDPPALVRAITWALDHPAEMQRMKASARKSAGLYSWRAITDLTHDALLSTLRQRQRGDP